MVHVVIHSVVHFMTDMDRIIAGDERLSEIMKRIKFIDFFI